MGNPSHKEVCPLCSHTRAKGRHEKCRSVFDDGNWKCHHCGADSGEENAERKQQYKQPDQKVPQAATSQEFRDVYESRGITKAVIERNKVWWNGKEIVFPYVYMGVIKNVKYRDLDKNFRQFAGAQKLWYGMDDIVDKKEVIIVEGEWDKLACEVAGFIPVVSVPDGASKTELKENSSKYNFMGEWMPLFDKAEKVIIAVDDDEPGHMLKQELIRRFGAERCHTVKWAEGCKDANAVLELYGILELMSNIEEAKPVPIEGLGAPSDFLEKVLDLYDNGLKGGLHTGWSGFIDGEGDYKYSVRAGDLNIITGRPSHGKSTWLSALMMNLITNHGWKFAVFSPENSPEARYVAMLSQLKTGKPFKAAR